MLDFNMREDFIEYLKNLKKKGEISLPISDETADKLLNETQEIETSSNFNEKLLSLMQKAHKERNQRKQKLANPLRLNTFGEYLRLLRKDNGYSKAELSGIVNIPNRNILKIERTMDSPIDTPVEYFSRLAKHFKIPPRITINLIEKSIRVFTVIQSTDAATTYARADTKIDESERLYSSDDATIKMLLALEADKETTELDSRWNTFRESLYVDLNNE